MLTSCGQKWNCIFKFKKPVSKELQFELLLMSIQDHEEKILRIHHISVFYYHRPPVFQLAVQYIVAQDTKLGNHLDSMPIHYTYTAITKTFGKRLILVREHSCTHGVLETWPNAFVRNQLNKSSEKLLIILSTNQLSFHSMKQNMLTEKGSGDFR